MIEIKPASIGDIPLIRQLAGITWEATYSSILAGDQIAYMLGLFYSEQSLRDQMEKGHQFLLLHSDHIPAGFASFAVQSNLFPLTYRIHKIYIDPAQQGKGLGKNLLDQIIHEVKAKHAVTLELNVNRNNKALGFYQKIGFVVRKEEDIAIGQGYFMNDYVMELVL